MSTSISKPRKRLSFNETYYRQDGEPDRYIRYRDVCVGDKVLLVARGSSGPQDARGNTQDAIDFLNLYASFMDAEIIGELKVVAPGSDPEWLIPAVEEAKEHGAKIVAESADRLIRHQFYHSRHNPHLMAGKRELELLGRIADGVVLTTFLRPNLPLSKVRRWQTKRGQRAKNSFGGRPKKPLQKSDLEACWELFKRLSS